MAKRPVKNVEEDKHTSSNPEINKQPDMKRGILGIIVFFSWPLDLETFLLISEVYHPVRIMHIDQIWSHTFLSSPTFPE